MKKLSKEQILMFALLWTAFGSTYLLRKPFGIVKLSIQETFELSEDALGYIDLAFSLPYAMVSVLFSNLGDIIGAKITLGGGMIGSAVVTSVMGLSLNYWMLLVLLFVSGAFQALTWPASCSIISTWFSEKSRTSFMGIFGTNMLAGSLASTVLTVYTAKLSGWKNVFYIPSLITAIIGLLVLFFAKTNISNEKKKQDVEANCSAQCSATKYLLGRNKSLNTMEVLRLPIAPQVALGLFCSKAIRNAVLFWLPFYLGKVLGFSESASGLIALTFEIGGFLGSIILTIAVDSFMHGKDLQAAMLASLLGAIFTAALLLVQRYGKVILYVSLFLSGAFTATVDIIFGGSLATKLGEQYDAKSSVIGVINGIGSIGGLVEGPVVGWLSYWLGMSSLVPFICVLFIVNCVLSLTAMYVQTRVELKSDVVTLESIERRCSSSVPV